MCNGRDLNDAHIERSIGIGTRHTQEIGLIDIALVIAKRKRPILWITSITILLAAAYGLLASNNYRAQTRIIVPSVTNLAAEVIKSNLVMDKVIQQLNLKEAYKKGDLQGARGALSKSIMVQSDAQTGIITISVRDSDPRRAAEISNALARELETALSELPITPGARMRLYYEKISRDVRTKLSASQGALKSLRDQPGAGTSILR